MLVALAIGLTFTACDDDDNNNAENGEETAAASAYIFTGTNSEGTANYIATVASLDEGESTIVGNGLETYTGTEWFTYKDKYLFRLQYNQGNNGGTSSYFLNGAGQIEQSEYTYDISRFTTFGINIFSMSARICSCSASGSCCVLTTIVSMRSGLPLSLYCTVT